MDEYCERCGLGPLDPEGCDDIGAIPPHRTTDGVFCGSHCAARADTVRRLEESEECIARTREIAGLAPGTPLELAPGGTHWGPLRR